MLRRWFHAIMIVSTYGRLALRLKPIIQEKAKENQIKSGGAVRQKSAQPVKTRDELAKLAGVSHDTTSILCGCQVL